MSVTTRDYNLHANELGAIRYTVEVYLWDGDAGERDPVEHHRVWPTEAAARASLTDVLPADAFADLRRGHWQREDIDDDEYGTIIDVEWVEDPDFYASAYHAPTGWEWDR